MKVTDDGVPVDALISVIKDSIKRAGVSRTSQSRDLQVASVKLILDVVASETAGGGLDFRVPFIGMKLRVGAKVTKKDTHTIDVTLIPPKDGDTRQVRGGDVEDVLVNAIATIRNVMTMAAEGDDPWVLSTSFIDISFAVTQTGTITLGVDGELANELTQTLRLSDWLQPVCEGTMGSVGDAWSRTEEPDPLRYRPEEAVVLEGVQNSAVGVCLRTKAEWIGMEYHQGSPGAWVHASKGARLCMHAAR